MEKLDLKPGDYVSCEIKGRKMNGVILASPDGYIAYLIEFYNNVDIKGQILWHGSIRGQEGKCGWVKKWAVEPKLRPLKKPIGHSVLHIVSGNQGVIIGRGTTHATVRWRDTPRKEEHQYCYSYEGNIDKVSTVLLSELADLGEETKEEEGIKVGALVYSDDSTNWGVVIDKSKSVSDHSPLFLVEFLNRISLGHAGNVLDIKGEDGHCYWIDATELHYIGTPSPVKVGAKVVHKKTGALGEVLGRGVRYATVRWQDYTNGMTTVKDLNYYRGDDTRNVYTVFLPDLDIEVSSGEEGEKVDNEIFRVGDIVEDGERGRGVILKEGIKCGVNLKGGGIKYHEVLLVEYFLWAGGHSGDRMGQKGHCWHTEETELRKTGKRVKFLRGAEVKDRFGRVCQVLGCSEKYVYVEYPNTVAGGTSNESGLGGLGKEHHCLSWRVGEVSLVEGIKEDRPVYDKAWLATNYVDWSRDCVNEIIRQGLTPSPVVVPPPKPLLDKRITQNNAPSWYLPKAKSAPLSFNNRG